MFRKKIIDFFLNRFETSDFVLRYKARILLVLLFACIVCAVLLNIFFVQIRESGIIEIPILSALIALVFTLYILKKGHFYLAGHSMLVISTLTVWTVMFMDDQYIFTRIDSISYVFTVFIMTSLVIHLRKEVIFIYLAANLTALTFFNWHTKRIFGISDAFFFEYLVDNTIGFVFISFISYQTLAINNAALSKAANSIQLANTEVEKNRELNKTLELKVAQRTEDLANKNKDLQKEIIERKQAEAYLKSTQKKLVESAHKAGMAAIAAETLHNVGNILNSVKTSSHIIEETIKNSPFGDYSKAVSVLKEHMGDIDRFIIENPKGKTLLQYFLQFEPVFNEIYNTIIQNTERLTNKVDIITNVMASQERHISSSSFTESLNIIETVEEALEIFCDTQEERNITIIKDFKPVPRISLHKTKLIHILVNLFKNSWEAMQVSEEGTENNLMLTISRSEEEVILVIEDSGPGISKENLEKIFNHGFTTKKDGFGFGLHSSANYLQEMGASIHASSEGKGAIFTLNFPMNPKKVSDS